MIVVIAYLDADGDPWVYDDTGLHRIVLPNEP
jgi:hypothetical protein